MTTTSTPMTDVRTDTVAGPQGRKYVRAVHVPSGLQVVRPQSEDSASDNGAVLADLNTVLEDAHFVRSAVSQGAGLDEVAHILVQGRGRPPLFAYRALQVGGAMQMAQAQALVRRNLSSGSPASAEDWWEAASWELGAPATLGLAPPAAGPAAVPEAGQATAPAVGGAALVAEDAFFRYPGGSDYVGPTA